MAKVGEQIAAALGVKPRKHGGKPFAKGYDPRKAPPQWKPGQSGNPSGFPKQNGFRERCREVAAELVDHIDTRIRAGRLSTAQVKGFEALRDSGYGRPGPDDESAQPPPAALQSIPTERLILMLIERRPETAENLRKLATLDLPIPKEPTDGTP